jgi:hypothetical protein
MRKSKPSPPNQGRIGLVADLIVIIKMPAVGEYLSGQKLLPKTKMMGMYK